MATKDIDGRPNNSRIKPRAPLLDSKSEYDREVWEGWTVRDFIEEQQPEMDMIMRGQSFIRPFKTKAEMQKHLNENRPHYKKTIPAETKYFAQRYGLKDIKSEDKFAIPKGANVWLLKENSSGYREYGCSIKGYSDKPLPPVLLVYFPSDDGFTIQIDIMALREFMTCEWGPEPIGTLREAVRAVRSDMLHPEKLDVAPQGSKAKKPVKKAPSKNLKSAIGKRPMRKTPAKKVTPRRK